MMAAGIQVARIMHHTGALYGLAFICRNLSFTADSTFAGTAPHAVSRQYAATQNGQAHGAARKMVQL